MSAGDGGRDQTAPRQSGLNHRLSAWLLAVRPKTLPAAISPVLVGTAMAWSDGLFDLLPALAAAAGALLLQILSNFANDYFDFAKGADTSERLGPTRVMAAGLLSPQAMRKGMAAVVALALLDGIYLVQVGGWPILAVGLASLVAAVLYTGGPFPFGYYGLGDLFVFVFFGLVAVAGTYFVQAGALSGVVLVVAVPVGALITAILVVNNLRDIATDARAGKRTLAVLIGARNSRLQYVLLLVLAYAAPFSLWLGFERGPAVLLPLLSLPLAFNRARMLYSATGTALNAQLAATAQLSLIYSLLMSLGLIL